ncbi:MAG: anaerobic sulfatase maturase [Clostridia bacterium]|nr:anaerobic sulfatase maturase [Clostridia bacterium]
MKNLTLLIKPASGLCQYRCEYCFYKDEMRLRGENEPCVMREDTLESLIRKAFAYGAPQTAFAFQGGEPTLAGLRFFENVVRLQKHYARGAAYANTLQTNGGMIDEQWAGFLSREHFLVGVSMDGDEESHDLYRKDAENRGTWLRTKEACALLKSHDVPFNVLCVVSKANVTKPVQTYEALKEYRFIQFIACLDAFGQKDAVYAASQEELAGFLKQTFDLYERDILNGEYTSVRMFDNFLQMLSGMRPESCAMNGRCSVDFTVESDGSVYPCDFYCLDEWKLGNIRETGFVQLERCETAKRFVNSSVSVPDKCKACKYYVLCRGGCRREREQAHDECGRPINRYCEAYRNFFDYAYTRLIALKERISALRR